MNLPRLNIKPILDHAPAILTAMGVAGVIGTAVLTARATSFAKDYIYEREPDIFQIEHENAVPLTGQEKFQLTWHLYVPAVATGAVSIACIIGSHSISVKRQAALMGLYSLTERALVEYERKTAEVVGEGKAREIQDRVAQGQVDHTPRSANPVIRTEFGGHLCFDSMNERYFTSSIERIKQTVEAVNEELRTKDTYVTVNEFFRRLGVPGVVLGDDIGWTSQRLMHISYTPTFDDFDYPALSLNYRAAPIRGPHLPERNTT